MPDILTENAFDADIDIDCLVIGGGAAGMTAALAANDRGLSVLVAEREDRLSGSTALSSGLIPAAETLAQKRQDILDSKEIFFADIMAKNKNMADAKHVKLCIEQVTKAIDWLEVEHDIPFKVLDSFLYPSHSSYRMHAVPETTGAALIQRLENAANHREILISCNLKITDLVRTNNNKIIGSKGIRPDGKEETIRARSVILACNGYGGNPDLIEKHIPEMSDALYFGHPGNQGEALLWGEKLDCKLVDLTGYQGHGSVAHPHGILITWGLMMEGGIQVNVEGKRFSNEHEGYSEQAVKVLAQPEQVAFNIFDERLLKIGREFEDFRNAETAKAIISADSIEELSDKLDLPFQNISETFEYCTDQAEKGAPDKFGRVFSLEKLLKPPFFAVKVTGTLFHTQGGLAIDEKARVIKNDGSVIQGLFACGGAVCGVSGPDVSGYLSGNGLLTAIGLGYLAGHEA